MSKNKIKEIEVVSSLEEISSDLVLNMPDVQEHAIQMEEEKEQNNIDKHSHLVDKDGYTFDPALHVVESDGTPKITAAGLLRQKPGHKNKSKIVELQKGKDVQQQRASGKVCASILIQLGISFGGEEWQPSKDAKTGIDEQAMLESAFSEYFEATGMSDLPPGIALTVAISAYALPRFTKPNTKKRTANLFKKFGGGMKKLFKRVRKNKPVKKEEE